ncbi:hypothetical protein HYX12_01565 [Candidatus Woesearchaeota archaeon]|nr:hypothetical protein [Candidatus Woesearchaeota archaeon]
MPNLFSTPVWFNGLDLIFESIGLIVALLIAAYSWRVYRVSRETKFQYFSLAFLSISFSLLVKVITSAVIYFRPVRMAADILLNSAVGLQREYSVLFYHAGFFLEMASMLGGWLLIFFISQKGRERLRKYYELSQIGLFVYLVVLISWIANFEYIVFYLTSTVLLGLIVLNYYKNYLNNLNKNTLLIMWSFIFTLIAFLFFVFIFVNSLFYVIGQVFLLIGFILLLYTYNRIINK